MATVARQISAPPGAVFDVLSDGWLYALWVVGASHIRDVDAGWPAAGTRIHHSVGMWPFLVSDETEVITSAGPGTLVLETKARPIGLARVTLTIDGNANGSLVTMVETPTRGPGKWVHNPVNDAVLRWRNIEALKRLASIVERRH